MQQNISNEKTAVKKAPDHSDEKNASLSFDFAHTRPFIQYFYSKH